VKDQDTKIAVIGLGYVGLPLAVEFAKHYPVVGFDISAKRVQELQAGRDHTLEVEPEKLAAVAGRITYTDALDVLKEATIYVVTVPTPIDGHKKPDLRPLLGASATVGKALKPGDLVIYESTVYPGCTEDECVPVLEAESGLQFNRDFFCGYSPERINPGDKEHTVAKIKKVTSGSTPEVAERVDALYRKVITAGTHMAASIKVAEAAKVIENAQRDLNIAFVNELALIFRKMGIDTEQVLQAAGTKWNFLPFRPGLVGGHCIGVDPYYLTYKAQAIGYNPEVILSGRRINDGMGRYVAGRLIKLMIQKGVRIAGARTLVMGITFKENCPDIRNSRVIDIVRELQEYGCTVDIYDPWADPEEVRDEYGIELVSNEAELHGDGYAGVCLAVAHTKFGSMDVRGLLDADGAVFDVKSFLPLETADERL
jgi:UDP-N-acetyl-D-glucosamine/UDP-N-acetyl-D-galactosamine dehydrogenase